MTRLWDKGEPLDDRIARLTVGRDPELDLRLVPYDALASAAHAEMLSSIGVLTEEERNQLVDALREIARDEEFAISVDDEDCHTAIENRLTEELGDAGKRIHTGRSRNDQVIAALRLWGREAVASLTDALLSVIDELDRLSVEHAEVSVPGYTHTRQAMPSTLGHLFAAHAESLSDQLPWLDTAYNHLNRSPLGSASGFGVALPLDRQQVSDRLGFDRVQVNSIAVQNDRGRTEALTLGVAASIATDLGRLAGDLIWYSTEELGYVELATETTTGSSIMPQKRNPDVLEVARAAAGRCRSLRSEVENVYGSLTSGYHRDLQLTKGPFLEGLVLATDVCAAVQVVLQTLTVDPKRCHDAVESATAATDAVYQRVAAGTPFRQAYREIGEDPAAAYEGDPAESWRLRTHLGAPGDTDRGGTEIRLAEARQRLTEVRKQLDAVWETFES